MPNTQTLKLFFDVTHAPGRDHGQFADDDFIHRSRVWLDQQGNAQPDSQSLTLNFDDHVDCRIDVDSRVPPGWLVSNLRITVALWRTHSAPNDASHDSPFVDGAGKQQIIFDTNFAGGGAGTLHLGVPTLKSGARGNRDRYLFLISAMLDTTDPFGTLHTYTTGHDPQMVVDL